MNKIITNVDELTPIENHQNILFKRDDLFIPYEINGVNGGKLRQCINLLKNNNYSHVYTYASLTAPSAPIVAAVCKNMNLSCTIYYGGTNFDSAMKKHMPRLVNYYNAELNFSCKTGRQSVLLHAIKQEIKEQDILIKYEYNVKNFPEAILYSNACQVKNIPNELNNLIITCGSGITAAGIIIGLKKYNKRVNNIILITTAPDRTKIIDDILNQHNCLINYKIIDLFHTSNFKYEKKENFIFDNIKLHPNYEAKTLKCFLESDFSKKNSLFWITGAYPELDI